MGIGGLRSQSHSHGSHKLFAFQLFFDLEPKVGSGCSSNQWCHAWLSWIPASGSIYHQFVFGVPLDVN